MIPSLRRGVLAATACLMLAACTSAPAISGDGAAAAGSGGTQSATTVPNAGPSATPPTTPAAGQVLLPGAGIPGVDITLGEWALVPSVTEAPPGQITFRFRNLGTVSHALRIRTAGSGRDRLEWRAEAIGPGETGLLVADLAPGTYEIDCPIEDAHGEHDQLGMEISFTVHDGAAELAPLPEATPQLEASDAAVAIAAFAFDPAALRVSVGTTVTWTNNDPTTHTVTGEDFDTGALEPSATGALTFDTTGTFDYFCAIHPSMQGRVVVEP